MIDQYINRLKKDKVRWDKVRTLFQEIEIGSKTILLNEGETSKNMYL